MKSFPLIRLSKWKKSVTKIINENCDIWKKTFYLAARLLLVKLASKFSLFLAFKVVLQSSDKSHCINIIVLGTQVPQGWFTYSHEWVDLFFFALIKWIKEWNLSKSLKKILPYFSQLVYALIIPFIILFWGLKVSTLSK